MAAIAVGTGGTLLTSSYEGQILELAQFLESLEGMTGANPLARDYITVSHSAGVSNISFNIPIVASIAGGNVTYGAPDYMATGFTPGTGGLITEETAAGYFVELVQRAQILESATSIDRINGSLNINTLRFSGSITLATTITLTTGGVLIAAAEYL